MCWSYNGSRAFAIRIGRVKPGARPGTSGRANATSLRSIVKISPGNQTRIHMKLRSAQERAIGISKKMSSGPCDVWTSSRGCRLKWNTSPAPPEVPDSILLGS